MKSSMQSWIEIVVGGFPKEPPTKKKGELNMSLRKRIWKLRTKLFGTGWVLGSFFIKPYARVAKKSTQIKTILFGISPSITYVLPEPTIELEGITHPLTSVKGTELVYDIVMKIAEDSAWLYNGAYDELDKLKGSLDLYIHENAFTLNKTTDIVRYHISKELEGAKILYFTGELTPRKCAKICRLEKSFYLEIRKWRALLDKAYESVI